MAFVSWLSDGLGALAAAWGLLGDGDTAATELLLLFLLLAGVLLVPLLEHRANGVLSGRHPPSQPCASPSLTVTRPDSAVTLRPLPPEPGDRPGWRGQVCQLPPANWD